ncbi:pyridoxal phosphate-dependent transferase [Jimgerdemannia flammicorona]|uniref:Pyridoxal phosphate-dependent transferase n=1 Tax=Jimgerdemannia flammicorona TaxID=994334 RepID=A0A433QTX8_9FUNG|nr:pyridoxal phosphate-dependent transferase [Jimgerdemannia flammicorona]
MLRHFLLEDGFVSLNHGSYGTYPRSVRDSLRAYQDLAESNPDRWMRKTMHDEMTKVRSRLGAFLNCPPTNLAIVPNTSAGINAILRSMHLRPGDKLLCLSTIYEAMHQTLCYLCDTHEGVSLVCVEVAYPVSDDALVEAVEQVIEEEERKEDGLVGGRIRIAIVDAISSQPGVRVPFERLVKVLKRHRILSLVDGAHAIGHIPLDLQELDPDFLVTNCHKWLYSVRGSAVLYVPRRWQVSVHPTSISIGYKDRDFQAEFEWQGTIDFSGYMTIPAGMGFIPIFLEFACLNCNRWFHYSLLMPSPSSSIPALDFRTTLGGESRIQSYCHTLAVQGGQLVARLWGTSVMENPEGTLTANMVNVRLPLTTPATDNNMVKRQVHYLMEVQLLEFRCFAAPYRHAGAWWVRMCAQVYNEIGDFEVVAKAFGVACKRLESVGGDVDKL